LALIRAEAEYYSLINVVEAIDSHKECKGISDDENIRDIPRIDGFYTNNRTGDALKVIHFRGKGKLTFLEGDSARNNVYLFHSVKDLPEMWKEDESTVNCYARYYQKHFHRGYYQVEGNCLYLKVAQNTTRIPGLYRKDFLLLPMIFQGEWDSKPFERYSFVPF